MTIAELYGKLSPDANERTEDLLTSDVFGTMRYAGWSNGFLEWLLEAEVPPMLRGSTNPIWKVIPVSNVKMVHVSFWPRLPNGREPDVALLVELSNESSVVVIVEAKYLSGTSDFVPEELTEHYRLTGNQIADQVHGLAAVGVEQVRDWFGLQKHFAIKAKVHLFITAHTRLPTADYVVANSRLSLPCSVHAFWLSWKTLANHLERYTHDRDAGRAALIQDLLRLLERKDLVPYSAFTQQPWAAPAVHPSFWSERWWQQKPAMSHVSPTFWRSITPDRDA